MNEPYDPNKSVFVDDWTDSKAIERYKFHAKEIYDSNRYMERASMQAYLDYAKWILVSLLTVHGGAIYAISTLRDKITDPFSGQLLMYAAIANVAGISLTLLTGGIGWLNFQASEGIYAARANPSTIYRNDQFSPPQIGSATTFMLFTYFAAAITAASSLVAFVVSATFVFIALDHTALCRPTEILCMIDGFMKELWGTINLQY
ncbi:hypothetical protein [Phyllobacterium bourgognense]|uniref:Uncharacterized protein n=1 Tax=Phyllobacterium bourgognense TaxID=314236 RepID=A0A368Z4P5_9HYPH|nr:hypothetical protein [Phyllobacterium bourgognense]RCW87420.1 hypothetical protein C7476_101182 [Phyllobacterium bourgognense]